MDSKNKLRRAKTFTVFCFRKILRKEKNTKEMFSNGAFSTDYELDLLEVVEPVCWAESLCNL